MTDILVSDLTQTTIDGNGVFDVLMKSVQAQLQSEYDKNRIKGAEYSTVYLGSLEAVMRTSLDFLLTRQKAAAEARILAQQLLLLQQQTANALIEADVLTAQKCKLQAEYDLTMQNTQRAIAETALLAQKNVTEKAQTLSVGVDVDSVVGKQKALYAAQTAGFARDAEQKAATLLVNSWNARRMTDGGTVADGTNQLNDATIGRAVSKMLTGIGA